MVLMSKAYTRRHCSALCFPDGYILGVSSTHKLENFHWYHELGPLLGFTKQVFVSLRSGAVLHNGHFL